MNWTLSGFNLVSRMVVIRGVLLVLALGCSWSVAIPITVDLTHFKPCSFQRCLPHFLSFQARNRQAPKLTS